MTTKIEVSREVRDQLWALEKNLDAVTIEIQAYVARLEQAKTELGLNGTFGDAALSKSKETLATVEQARAQLGEHHKEIFAVSRALGVPSIMFGPKLSEASQSEDTRIRA